MAWQIEFTKSAAKQLKKLDPHTAKLVVCFLRERVENSDDPRNSGKALTGNLGTLWRYRFGDYRVICDIQDDVLRVLVITIGHRRNVYD